MGFTDFFKKEYQSSDPEARLKAVESLDDPRILARLAREDTSPRVRTAAVKRLTDQALLAEVALGGKEIDARLAAVERIESQEKLAEIIKIRRNLRLMGACFAKITDKKLLERIAHDPDYNMSARRMAIDNYADESFISDLEPSSRDHGEPKSPEEIATFIEKYGAVRLARAIGKFRGSHNAILALGEIIKHSGEGAVIAIDYLAQALIHANAKVRQAAEDQLSELRQTEQVLHLIRMMDNTALHGRILEVLRRIDHPEARQLTERD